MLHKSSLYFLYTSWNRCMGMSLCRISRANIQNVRCNQTHEAYSRILMQHPESWKLLWYQNRYTDFNALSRLYSHHVYELCQKNTSDPQRNVSSSILRGIHKFLWARCVPLVRLRQVNSWIQILDSNKKRSLCIWGKKVYVVHFLQWTLVVDVRGIQLLIGVLGRKRKKNMAELKP